MNLEIGCFVQDRTPFLTTIGRSKSGEKIGEGRDSPDLFCDDGSSTCWDVKTCEQTRYEVEVVLSSSRLWIQSLYTHKHLILKMGSKRSLIFIYKDWFYSKTCFTPLYFIGNPFYFLGEVIEAFTPW